MQPSPRASAGRPCRASRRAEAWPSRGRVDGDVAGEISRLLRRETEPHEKVRDVFLVGLGGSGTSCGRSRPAGLGLRAACAESVVPESNARAFGPAVFRSCAPPGNERRGENLLEHPRTRASESAVSSKRRAISVGASGSTVRLRTACTFERILYRVSARRRAGRSLRPGRLRRSRRSRHGVGVRVPVHGGVVHTAAGSSA